MLEPEVETRSAEDQFRLDDLYFRRQAAYLVERAMEIQQARSFPVDGQAEPGRAA